MKKIIVCCVIYSLSFNVGIGAEAKFIVNPDTLQDQLLNKNSSLLVALNNVQNSKLQVSQARAKLLPSLNLSVMLPALANPTFLLSSVSFLFPFLVPSNWMALKQQKELFEADKMAYKALQLNVLSSALSLYYMTINDQKIQQVYSEQQDVLHRLYTNLKRQSEILGNVTAEDLAMAQAQWEEAKIKVSRLEELLVEERAGLRTMLGLSLATSVDVKEVDVPASDYEDRSILEIVDRAFEVAPESKQMQHLIKASKTGKFSKMFGFISNASIGGSVNNNASVFDSMKAQGSFSFGAENLVNFKIANNNLEALKLRQDQLRQENERISEIFVGKIIEVKEQLQLSNSVLENRMKVFEAQSRQFALGLIPLQILLQTQSQLTDIKVSLIKAQFDYHIQQLSLSRLVIDGFFSSVKGCTNTSGIESKGLFNRKKEQGLDQLCKGSL